MNSCQLHDALKIFLISPHFPFHIFTLHFIFCLSHACCCLNEEKIKLNLRKDIVSSCNLSCWLIFLYGRYRTYRVASRHAESVGRISYYIQHVTTCAFVMK